MKIDEVMLGDIVSVSGRPIHVTLAVLNNWSNSIEPIPITPKILGKNFELLFSKKGIYIYSGINGRFFILNNYNVKGWEWMLDYNEKLGTASACGMVNYIHELQHRLRINRIDKEIEL